MSDMSGTTSTSGSVGAAGIQQVWAGRHLYHTSSEKNRKSILQQGLRASTPDTAPDQPRGVYLSEEPDEMPGHDQWKVNVHGLPLEDDPDSFQSMEYGTGRSFYVPHDIPPERMKIFRDRRG